MSDLYSSFSLKKSYHSLFHRPNSGHPVLDGFRAIGMLWVILTHTVASAALLMTVYLKPEVSFLGQQVDHTPWYFDWIWNGHLMVDMFFVLSGFLIAGLLLRDIDKHDGIQLKRFYYRRFMRLMPTYLLVIALFYMMNMPHRENLWQNLLYINNFFPHGETAAPWTWSLAIEEQFYLIFPLFALFVLRTTQRPILWLSGLLVFACIIRLYIVWTDEILHGNQMSVSMIDKGILNHGLTVIYDNLYTRYGAFICGIGAQYIYHYQREKMTDFFLSTLPGKASIFFSLVISITLLEFNPLKSDIVLPEWAIVSFIGLYRNIFSLCIALLILAMLVNSRHVSWLTRFLSLRIWYPFAQLTYCAYLIHIPIIIVTLSILNKVYVTYDLTFYYGDYKLLIITFAVASTLTYFVSAIIYFSLERPMMTFRDLRSNAAVNPEPATIELDKRATT
ncbi:MAG: hypothetical protein COA99_07925 [Moraxellaceae bacterium]|nr:MAG: hypothetical protein COA99_07925 [Moraxellaceae bacterium]